MMYWLARETGFNLEKLVWVHAQNGSDSMRIKMGRAGMWISLDGVNARNLDDYVNKIIAIRDAALLKRLLISHDDGWSVDSRGRGPEISPFNNGNSLPYTTIENLLLPELRRAGFTEGEINQLLVENPKRLLSRLPI